MIANTPQPQMFGGKRPRKYVLAGSNEYSYPSTLGVGSSNGDVNEFLGENFWGHMGDEDEEQDLQGGKHGTWNNFRNFEKVLGSVAKTVAPVAKPIFGALTDRAVQGIEGAGIRRRGRPRKNAVYNDDMEGGKHGTWNNFRNFEKVLGRVAKTVAPVAKPIFGALTDRAVQEIQGAGRRPRGRPKKMIQQYEENPDEYSGGKHGTWNNFRNFEKVLGSVAKTVAPVAKPIFGALTDRAVQEIQGSGRGGKHGTWNNFRNFEKVLGSVAKTVAPVAKPILGALTDRAVQEIQGSGRRPRGRPKGGALISYHPNEFQDYSYPPSLMKVQKKGSGIKRPNPRGEIVKKVMKQHGLSLSQASSYVKQHNLY